MKVKRYDDGIAFLKDGVEIAFYSYIVNRVAFYPSNKGWYDYDCSSVKVEDLIIISDIVKDQRKRIAEIEIKNN